MPGQLRRLTPTWAHWGEELPLLRTDCISLLCGQRRHQDFELVQCWFIWTRNAMGEPGHRLWTLWFKWTRVFCIHIDVWHVDKEHTEALELESWLRNRTWPQKAALFGGIKQTKKYFWFGISVVPEYGENTPLPALFPVILRCLLHSSQDLQSYTALLI